MNAVLPSGALALLASATAANAADLFDVTVEKAGVLIDGANQFGSAGGAGTHAVTFSNAGYSLGHESDNHTVGFFTAQSGTPAVPEPATWAMMIGGFGLIGGAMRRRRTATVTYA